MTTYDLFLAHASADRDAAEALFALLSPDVRVWLDTKSLLPGDDWTREIPRAQRASAATVVLVSRHADEAFYMRDEIHTAIDLYRRAPGDHRVVAVFLDGRPTDMAMPYGLRILNGLDAVAEGGLEGVARRLRDLVSQLQGRAAPPPPPAEPLAGPALYDKLCKLTLGAQIDGVILRAGLPVAQIRPAAAPVAQRAMDIVHMVDAGGPDLAARVAAAIAKEAPYLGGAHSAAAARPAAAPPAPGKVSVLLVFANPAGTDPLRLGAEERALRQSLQLSRNRDRFEVEALHAATIDDLRRALIDKPRTIVHFSGHGEEDGLQFEDEKGESFTPDAAALASLLRRRGVETVVLNACYGATVVAAAPMGTRYTVAMEGPVSDAGSIEFSRGFYDVLGAGGGVPDAFEEGRDAAKIKRVPVEAVLIKG